MKTVIALVVEKLRDTLAFLVECIYGELASGLKSILAERGIIKQLCNRVVGNIVRDVLN